jgi:peptidoglycan/LPS O-acetylase OafA/YrhL
MQAEPITQSQELRLAQAPELRTADTGPKHIPVLDGVRGLAILLVLICHGALISARPGGFDHFFLTTLRTGWIGVDLFFVLSGYLITGILLREKGKPRCLRNFYIRRFLRIFPMYYGFLFLVFAVAPLIRPFHSPVMIGAAHDQIWLWTYSMNFAGLLGYHPNLDAFGQFWSLAVEEHFYMAWPLLVLLLSRAQMATASVICIVGSLLLRIALWFALGDPHVTYDFTLCRLDGLAMGGLIAVAMQQQNWRSRLVPIARIVGPAAAAFLLAIFLRYGSWWADPPIPLIGYTLLALVFGSALVLAITARQGLVVRALNSKFLRLFGKHSYSIYVIHYPLQPLVWTHVYFARLQTRSSVVPAVIVANVLEIAVFLLLSMLTWHLWEKHFIKLKDKFAPVTA